MRMALRAALSVGLALTLWATSFVLPAQAHAKPGRVAATMQVALEVASDGTRPLNDTDDRPGLDSSLNNDRVRSGDSIAYHVHVQTDGEDITNGTFTMTAPPGTRFSSVPSECDRATSRIDGQQLICNLGTITRETRRVPVVLQVDPGTADGTDVPMTVTASGDGATSAVSQTLTTKVTSAPMYDLSKLDGQAKMVSAVGRDGSTPGRVIIMPVSVLAAPQATGQATTLGLEALASPLRFTDDISNILAGNPSTTAVPYDWGGGPACGPNSASVIPGLPAGTGGGARGVADSGTFTCTQPGGAGTNVSVTITGANTSAQHLPTQNSSGASLPADKAYVVAGFLQLWVSEAEIREKALDSSTNLVKVNNTYTGFAPSSVTGQPNYAPDGEPLGNNPREFTLGAGYPGTGKRYLSPADGPPGTATAIKAYDGYVAPGQELNSIIIIDATTTSLGVSGFVACDKFDNRYQTLIPGSDGSYGVARGAGLTNVKISYAAATSTDPVALQNGTCTDADGPWFDDPTKVPGGVEAVARIRYQMDVKELTYGGVRHRVRIRSDAPTGTRVRNFGSVWSPGRNWLHNRRGDADGAEEAEGTYADHVTVAEVIARVSKKVVDPGSTAETTPDRTREVSTGGKVTFALRPTLTAGAASSETKDVTVTDTLPKYLSYAGNASVAPQSVTENPDGTTTIVWVLPKQKINEAIAPITFDAMADPLAPNTTVNNRAIVSAPGDGSPESQRTADRAVNLVVGAALAVKKEAVEPTVVVRDELKYNLTLVNRGSDAIPDLDLIDVLPYLGDNRAIPSKFTGKVYLAAPVPTAAGTVLYTKAQPASINLDPQHSTNASGGGTTWCTQTQFGSAGCPANLMEATGFRVKAATELTSGAQLQIPISLKAPAALDGEVFTNAYGGRGGGLKLPVQSNHSTVHVVSGSIGDHVWLDADKNGIQDAVETPVPDVTVTLDGTDDLGATVHKTATTDKNGKYLFTGLRPGTYKVTFTNPDGTRYRWTIRQAGDADKDSDADDQGESDDITLSRQEDSGGKLTGVTSDLTIDAGLISSVPRLESEKTVDRTTTGPGGTVTYTITLKNTGDGDFTDTNPATYTDDVSRVLDDAVYSASPTSSGGGTFSRTGDKLTWSGPLKAGETVELTFSVTVPATPRPGADGTLHNGTTTVKILRPKLKVVKTADRKTVRPGEKVKYTITLTNTGNGDFTRDDPAKYRDDLTKVIDDAVYNNDAKTSAGTLSYKAPILSWSGALAAGKSATITFTVKVHGNGDRRLLNGTTAVGVVKARLQIVKKADRKHVKPGQHVTYTVTVTNLGPGAYPGASFTDDLSDVLKQARYDHKAKASSGTLRYHRPKLTWRGDLTVGGKATITYRVTVKPKVRNGRLRNTVIGSRGSNCPPDSKDPRCRTEVWTVPPGPRKDR